MKHEPTIVRPITSLALALHVPRSTHFFIQGSERQRAEAFALRKAGEAALLTCLQRLYPDAEPTAWLVRRDERGRPSVRHQDIHSPVFISIAHTHGIAVAAASASGPIGIDVESLHRRVDVTAFAQEYFHPREQQWLAGAEDDQRTDAFFRLWTLKEAYGKTTHHGLMTTATTNIDTVMVEQLHEPPDRRLSFYSGVVAQKFRVTVAAACQDHATLALDNARLARLHTL